MPAKKSTGTKAKGHAEHRPTVERAMVSRLADALAGEPRKSIGKAAQRAFDIAHELRNRPVGPRRANELRDELNELVAGIATLQRNSAVEGCRGYSALEKRHRTNEIKTVYVLHPALIFARAHVAEQAAKSRDWEQVQERMGDILEWCEKGNGVLRALPPLADRENVLRAVCREVATLAKGSGVKNPTRKGGRPALRDNGDDPRIVAAWRSGDHRTMKDCAAALGGKITCHDVRQVLDRQRKRAARMDKAVK